MFTENPMAAQKDDMADIVAEDSNAALLPNWFERTLRVVRKADGAPTALARAVPALTVAMIVGSGYYCLGVRVTNIADPSAWDIMLMCISSTLAVLALCFAVALKELGTVLHPSEGALAQLGLGRTMIRASVLSSLETNRKWVRAVQAFAIAVGLMFISMGIEMLVTVVIYHISPEEMILSARWQNFLTTLSG